MGSTKHSQTDPPETLLNNNIDFASFTVYGLERVDADADMHEAPGHGETPRQRRDPYKVLCLQPGFTLEELRSNYKRLALQLHPDKISRKSISPETAKAVFQVLSDSYQELLLTLQEGSSRHDDLSKSPGTFFDLRAAYSGSKLNSANLNQQASQQKSPQAAGQPTSRPGVQETQEANQPRKPHSSGHAANQTSQSTTQSTKQSRDDEGFDLQRFNEVFQAYRPQTAYDRGYGDWMTAKPHDERDAKRTAMIARAAPLQPMALVALKPKSLGFTELGEEQVDDFGRATADRKTLAFSDYKLAHTVDARLIQETEVAQPRRNYTNVQELESERARPLQSTASEREAHGKLLQQEALVQQRRQQALENMDREAALQHERMSRLLLASRA